MERTHQGATEAGNKRAGQLIPHMARPRFVCLMLALVTVLLYLPARQYSFIVFDDPDYVSENRIVQSGLTLNGVRWAFTTFHLSNWHPLTWLSLMLDCHLFGPDAGAIHLINVIFHAANAVLLFMLLLRMTNALWPSALVAALFAWHPLHVESVAWIAERKDVLSTFFGMLALICYVRYADDKIRHSSFAIRHYALSLVCFALSLMSKPMLVTLPFVMLLLDYWPLGRFTIHDLRFTRPQSVWSFVIRHSSLVREKIPFFILTIASCVVTFIAQRAEAVVALDSHPLGLRIANAVVSYARYLQKMIWPADLAVIYPLPGAIPWTHVAFAAIVLAAISRFAWRQRLRGPHWLVGWLWFLGTLVPVIGLVQVGGQSMADRYSYWPLVGVFIAIAFGAQQFSKSRPQLKKGMAAVAVLLLAGCLVATANQLRYWRDSVTLFTRTVAVTKDNFTALINLGVALEGQGRKDEALVQYSEALRVNSGRVQVHNNLANLLDEMGRTDEAAAHYREALRLKPSAPLAHLNYGAFLVRLGKFDDAQRHYAEATRLLPRDPRPYYLMGRAKQLQNDPVAAIACFRDALKLDANNLQTLTALARILAADETPASLRNAPESIALAERANAVTSGQQIYVLETLALAYAAAGRTADAQQVMQQAIVIAEANGDKEGVEHLRQQLTGLQSRGLK